MKTAMELIAEERQRQIEKEGFSPEHDDEHSDLNGEYWTYTSCILFESQQEAIKQFPYKSLPIVATFKITQLKSHEQ